MRKGLALIVLTGLIAGGCSNERAWAYAPGARSGAAPEVAGTLAVSRLIDRRPNDNANDVLLYLIPLMPFGWQDFGTPEGASVHVGSGLWKFTPPEDLARAIAQEIDSASIFRQAVYQERPAAGDYVLTGEILSTKYGGTMISYGLSVYGPVLWFFGLPAGVTSNEIDVRLTLTGPAGAQLWTYSVVAADSKTHWIYSMGSDFRYDLLLKSKMPELLASLRSALAAPAR